jgi:hypothetical protein
MAEIFLEDLPETQVNQDSISSVQNCIQDWTASARNGRRNSCSSWMAVCIFHYYDKGERRSKIPTTLAQHSKPEKARISILK